MEKSKQILVTGGIPSAIDALTVLNAICKWLDVGDRQRNFVAFKLESGTGCLGYYVNQPPENASKEFLNLQKATRPNGCLAWLGYEHDADGKTNKAVWFYFNLEKERDELLRKLKERFETAPNRDEKDYCVQVTSPLQPSEHDFDWFESVINFAIH